jgi:hypothetical protein
MPHISDNLLIYFGLVLLILYLACCRVLRHELLPRILRLLYEFLIYWFVGFVTFGLFMHFTSSDPWTGAAFFVSPLSALMAMYINNILPKRYEIVPADDDHS